MRKVVIVDDDRWALEDICASFMFEKNGFEVIGKYQKAEDALPIILNKRPDLVITDIRMDGMDGLELLRLCREKMVNTYFIVISGYDLFEYAQKAVNIGADYYLLKPINTSEVQELMQKLVLQYKDLPEEASNDTFSEIARYVKQHFAENITLSTLSKTFYLDKAYLSRLFSRKLHVTFTEYKQKLQISRAMDLLDAGNSINDVSIQVGFNDIRYFFRVFKKMTGTTPYQYKKR